MSILVKKKIFYHRSWQRIIAAGAGLFCLFFFTIAFQTYAAGPPAVVSYQGRLANAAGSLLGGSSGTTYYFKFSLWDAATNGNKLWPISSNPSVVAVTVKEGVFNVNIGDTANGYPDTLDYDFSSTNVFLKVEVSSTGVVNSFEALTPRQQLSSTAFAQVAGTVVSASSTITNLTSNNATSTNATTTNFFATTASTTNLFANILNAGASIFSSLLVNGSTTLQNATATALYTSTLAVGNTTSIFGGALQAPSLRTSLSSTAGLILGSTSTPQILGFDTINNRIQTGIGAGSNAPVLFILDTKNTTGDPAGTNGAMYYNSNMSSFRCYQNGQWETCGGNATSTFFLVTGSS